MTYDSLLVSVHGRFSNVDSKTLEEIVDFIYNKLYDSAFDDGYDAGVADSKEYYGVTLPSDDDVDGYDVVKASSNEDAYDSVKASENEDGYDAVKPKDEDDHFMRDPVDGHILSGTEWYALNLKYMAEHDKENRG